MTLKMFEERLQAVNPRLRIKRYGTSMAGIHLGNQYLLRVPQGEITPYNVTVAKVGKADQHVSDLNPKGYYQYQKLLRRGRWQVSVMLANMGVISNADAAKLRK